MRVESHFHLHSKPILFIYKLDIFILILFCLFPTKTGLGSSHALKPPNHSSFSFQLLYLGPQSKVTRLETLIIATSLSLDHLDAACITSQRCVYPPCVMLPSLTSKLFHTTFLHCCNWLSLPPAFPFFYNSSVLKP